MGREREWEGEWEKENEDVREGERGDRKSCDVRIQFSVCVSAQGLTTHWHMYGVESINR